MNDDKSVLVYVAGPYTHGDVAVNVRRAMLASQEIMKRGHLFFSPHQCHFNHLLDPTPYEVWLSMDLRMLRRCDVLLRLEGHSPGADREVEAAKAIGMPIYYALEDCLRDLPAMEVQPIV